MVLQKPHQAGIDCGQGLSALDTKTSITMMRLRQPLLESRGATSRTRSISHFHLTTVCTHLFLSLFSFHLGFLLGSNSTYLDHSGAMRKLFTTFVDKSSNHETRSQGDVAERRFDRVKRSNPKRHSTMKQMTSIFPPTIQDLFAGAAVVPRDKFAKTYDVGVPLMPASQTGNSAVLLLYGSESSLPKQHNGSAILSYANVHDATANCNVMKVILTEPRDKDNSCLAIMGQWESYDVLKFMRLPKNLPIITDPSAPVLLNSHHAMTLVGASTTNKGKTLFPPEQYHTKRSLDGLVDYLTKLHSTLARLRPIVMKAAGPKGNTVVIMVCNLGQATMLSNFVCSARASGIDLLSVVLFATDAHTATIGQSLGLHVFDVGDAFGSLPTEAAASYGDLAFTDMMLAKVYVAHLVNQLGYDFLYQDVDVVWYRDPRPFFARITSRLEFDLYFQDDGARSSRFAPYAANSGFYFVRHNARTEYFFSCLIRSTDLILKDGSHQSALIALLSHHAKQQGLRIKVFGIDTELGQYFPGGFHYHRRDDLMKRISTGSHVPYMFHMSWTEHMGIKKQYMEQMGQWFVKPICDTAIEESIINVTINPNTCCYAVPPIVCHYKDKPSKIPCRDVPSMMEGKESFW